jgi:hypothetical protein
MNMVTDLFQQAQLAEAAYANFIGSDGSLVTDDDSIKTALMASGISPTQATNFVSQWKVLAHQPNTDSDSDSGFSATLFENTDTGEKTLAIRGTERGSFTDWLTNYIDIGLIGSTGLQEQYQDLRTFYQQLVIDGKLGSTENFDVAGHSLGGFNAIQASDLFVQTAVVSIEQTLALRDAATADAIDGYALAA